MWLNMFPNIRVDSHHSKLDKIHIETHLFRDVWEIPQEGTCHQLHPGMNNGEDERLNLCHWQPWSKFTWNPKKCHHFIVTLPTLSGSYCLCTFTITCVHNSKICSKHQDHLARLWHITPFEKDHTDKDPTLKGLENGGKKKNLHKS
jgi:hypothetical protein